MLHDVTHEFSVWAGVDEASEGVENQSVKRVGQGDLICSLIPHGKPTYLFFERSTYKTGNVIGRWFVERRIS